MICEFSKASRTPDDLNLGPKTITVWRLRPARCVDSWSTALSRFAFDSSPKMVTIGPLFRKSLGSTHEVDGQLKFCTKIKLQGDLNIFKTICLFVYLSLCQFVSLSVCQFVSLSVCQFVSLSVCQFVSLSVCQFVCLSVCLFVCLSVCLFVCLSVCLLIYCISHSWAPVPL